MDALAAQGYHGLGMDAKELSVDEWLLARGSREGKNPSTTTKTRTNHQTSCVRATNNNTLITRHAVGSCLDRPGVLSNILYILTASTIDTPSSFLS